MVVALEYVFQSFLFRHFLRYLGDFGCFPKTRNDGNPFREYTFENYVSFYNWRIYMRIWIFLTVKIKTVRNFSFHWKCGSQQTYPWKNRSCHRYFDDSRVQCTLGTFFTLHCPPEVSLTKRDYDDENITPWHIGQRLVAFWMSSSSDRLGNEWLINGSLYMYCRT